MASGTVVTIDSETGRGIISPDSRGEPIAFDADTQRRHLSPGDKVVYSVQVTSAGLIAHGVDYWSTSP